jgi:hypothetical protein
LIIMIDLYYYVDWLSFCSVQWSRRRYPVIGNSHSLSFGGQ